MFTKYKKIIIGTLVLILGFVVYTVFLKPDPQAENLLKNSNPKQVDALGQEIIRSLSKIQSLRLDQSVFSDPIYLKLVDDTEEIPEPEVGRLNPFEPLPIEGIGTASDSEQEMGTANSPEQGLNNSNFRQ